MNTTVVVYTFDSSVFYGWHLLKAFVGGEVANDISGYRAQIFLKVVSSLKDLIKLQSLFTVTYLPQMHSSQDQYLIKTHLTSHLRAGNFQVHSKSLSLYLSRVNFFRNFILNDKFCHRLFLLPQMQIVRAIHTCYLNSFLSD